MMIVVKREGLDYNVDEWIFLDGEEVKIALNGLDEQFALCLPITQLSNQSDTEYTFTVYGEKSFDEFKKHPIYADMRKAIEFGIEFNGENGGLEIYDIRIESIEALDKFLSDRF